MQLTVVIEVDRDALDSDPGETLGPLFDRVIETISDTTKNFGSVFDAGGQPLGTFELDNT